MNDIKEKEQLLIVRLATLLLSHESGYTDGQTDGRTKGRLYAHSSESKKKPYCVSNSVLKNTAKSVINRHNSMTIIILILNRVSFLKISFLHKFDFC
jgi:hypothetical protein